jgi:isoleucyl-tRNA synthetase
MRALLCRATCYSLICPLQKDPLSLPPTTVRDEARTFAHSQVDSQRDAFRKLGIMADWHNSKATYRTLDHDYEIRQLRVFQKMVENGVHVQSDLSSFYIYCFPPQV